MTLILAQISGTKKQELSYNTKKLIFLTHFLEKTAKNRENIFFAKCQKPSLQQGFSGVEQKFCYSVTQTQKKAEHLYIFNANIRAAMKVI